MLTFLDPFAQLLTNNFLVLTGLTLSICCKLFIFCYCLISFIRKTESRLLYFFLMLFLIGTLIDDSTYLGGLILRKILVIQEDIAVFTFFCRIGWVLFFTRYQALAMFFFYFAENKLSFRYIYIPHILANIGVSSAFAYLAFFKYNVPSASAETLGFEISLIQAAYIYLPILYIPLLYSLYRKVQANKIPRILSSQLKILSNFFIPYLLLDTVNCSCSYLGMFFPFFSMRHSYSFFSITTLLCTAGLYYCVRRVVGLRFLNIKKDVQSKEKFNFLSKFKDILEQLSYATALKELGHLTQTFFQIAFHVPLGRTRFYMRKAEEGKDDIFDLQNVRSKVERFLARSEKTSNSELVLAKILIRDEIEFTQFYNNDEQMKETLLFLDSINADIFLPIFERNAIVSYIVVERNARPGRLFTNKERDEMLVFTSYLSNVINILKFSNIEVLYKERKELAEELYHKHQEINQYKESIRSFLRSNKERKIGLVFYKNRRFTFGNEAAQELVGFDLNGSPGHTLSKAFNGVASRVQEFRTPQTSYARDMEGNRLVIAGIPSMEDHTIILHVYYPEISDLIRAQFDQLKDPSLWDYVLYLETTHSGQLINQLMPGTSQKILNFKIKLLSTALSKKATLLDMPVDDIKDTVEILHHISLRTVLHELKLAAYEKNNDAAILLFGLNPLLQSDAPEPLLKKLNGVGTLFIENIEYLSIETQNYLAEFLQYGFFHKFKSDQKVFSNVRIICSTSKNLASLVDEGTFSETLFSELNKTSLTLPPLHTLSEIELEELAQGFAEQMSTEDTYKNLLALTERDKHSLLSERPYSLREFKEKVHQLLKVKSTKQNLQDFTEFDRAYNVVEPDVAHAVRLGKKALKDPQVMSLLWSKFKNQNKIALLLGVNRSSVNRRCQEYNLE